MKYYLIIALAFLSCSLDTRNRNISRTPRFFEEAMINHHTAICNPEATIYVAIDPNFDNQHKDWIRRALPFLRAYNNMNFVARNTNPTVTVKSWENWNNSTPRQRCTNGRIGQYRFGRESIDVDYTCAKTQQQFMAVIVHELGHWMGLTHVCTENGKTTDNCSSVGRGVAVMNPFLTPDHVVTPTDLDLSEYDRVYISRCELY